MGDKERQGARGAFVGEHNLTEGMAVFVPVYRLLGKIGLVRNISNKISIFERI